MRKADGSFNSTCHLSSHTVPVQPRWVSYPADNILPEEQRGFTEWEPVVGWIVGSSPKNSQEWLEPILMALGISPFSPRRRPCGKKRPRSQRPVPGGAVATAAAVLYSSGLRRGERGSSRQNEDLLRPEGNHSENASVPHPPVWL